MFSQDEDDTAARAEFFHRQREESAGNSAARTARRPVRCRNIIYSCWVANLTCAIVICQLVLEFMQTIAVKDGFWEFLLQVLVSVFTSKQERNETENNE